MTPDFTLTNKQYEFFHTDLPRWSVLCGAVRSGKTLGTLLYLPLFLNQNGGNAILGYSLNTIHHNILMPLMAMFPKQVEFKRNSNQANIFGIPVFLFSTGQPQYAARLQGLTLNRAYVDEAQLCNYEVFSMLQTRLSTKDAKCIMTANPTSPNSWLYKFIKANEDSKDLFLQTYLLEDNPNLPPGYVESLKRELQGTVFYDRLINGLWTSTEGLIFTSFTDDLIIENFDKKFVRYAVGIDYGSYNATVFILIGITANNEYFVINEYYYSGRDNNKTKTDSEYADDLQAFLYGLNVSAVVIDPSAASFIAECQKRRLPVKKADNRVIDGIRVVSSLFGSKRLYVSKDCPNLLRELRSYRWDLDSDIDKPIKENDHCCDALRYCVMHLSAPTNKVAAFY